MIVVSILPYLVGMSRTGYLVGALLLGGRFLYWVIRLKYQNDPVYAMRTFRYSIIYLMGLFVCLLIDHYIPYA